MKKKLKFSLEFNLPFERKGLLHTGLILDEIGQKLTNPWAKYRINLDSLRQDRRKT